MAMNNNRESLDDLIKRMAALKEQDKKYEAENNKLREREKQFLISNNIHDFTMSELIKECNDLNINMEKPGTVDEYVPMTFSEESEEHMKDYLNEQEKRFTSDQDEYNLSREQGQRVHLAEPRRETYFNAGELAGYKKIFNDKEENKQKKREAIISIINNENQRKEFNEIIKKREEIRNLKDSIKTLKLEYGETQIKISILMSCLLPLENILNERDFWINQRSGKTDALNEVFRTDFFSQYKSKASPICIEDYRKCILNFSKIDNPVERDINTFVNELMKVEKDRAKREATSSENTTVFSQLVNSLASNLRKGDYNKTLLDVNNLNNFHSKIMQENNNPNRGFQKK